MPKKSITDRLKASISHINTGKVLWPALVALATGNGYAIPQMLAQEAVNQSLQSVHEQSVDNVQFYAKLLAQAYSSSCGSESEPNIGAEVMADGVNLDGQGAGHE